MRTVGRISVGGICRSLKLTSDVHQQVFYSEVSGHHQDVSTDMYMYHNNKKHLLSERKIKNKDQWQWQCDPLETLQAATRADNLQAQTKRNDTREKTHTDFKKEPVWPWWSCLGTQTKRKRDEGRPSEIHLYYVIKGEREADWPVRDRVM